MTCAKPERTIKVKLLGRLNMPTHTIVLVGVTISMIYGKYRYGRMKEKRQRREVEALAAEIRSRRAQGLTD